MTEPSRPSWGDIIKSVEESPRPVPAPVPVPDPVTPVDIPAPVLPTVPAAPEEPTVVEAQPPTQASPPPYEQPAPAAASAAHIPYPTVPGTGTVPPPAAYPYGGIPAGYGGMPAAPGPSSTFKVFQVVAAAVLLAALAFGGYWAYGTVLAKKDTQTEAASDSDAKPGPDAGDQPMSPVPASPPAPASAPTAGGYPMGDEELYLTLLRNKPDMVITNPDRLLDLGKEVCVYLGTQTASPPEVIANVRQLLLSEGATSTDGLHITGAAVTALCPQHKSKIIPGR